MNSYDHQTTFIYIDENIFKLLKRLSITINWQLFFELYFDTIQEDKKKYSFSLDQFIEFIHTDAFKELGNNRELCLLLSHVGVGSSFCVDEKQTISENFKRYIVEALETRYIKCHKCNKVMICTKWFQHPLTKQMLYVTTCKCNDDNCDNEYIYEQIAFELFQSHFYQHYHEEGGDNDTWINVFTTWLPFSSSIKQKQD